MFFRRMYQNNIVTNPVTSLCPLTDSDSFSQHHPTDKRKEDPPNCVCVLIDRQRQLFTAASLTTNEKRTHPAISPSPLTDSDKSLFRRCSASSSSSSHSSILAARDLHAKTWAMLNHWRDLHAKTWAMLNHWRDLHTKTWASLLAQPPADNNMADSIARWLTATRLIACSTTGVICTQRHEQAYVSPLAEQATKN